MSLSPDMIHNLAQQCSEINDVTAGYQKLYRYGGLPIREHELQTQEFAHRCLAAAVMAKQAFGSEADICVGMSDLDALFPGASHGYLAALGLSCGWDHPASGLMLARVAELARSMGSSVVSRQARPGYEFKCQYAWTAPEDGHWDEQTIGYLLLNGPKRLLANRPQGLKNNPEGMCDFFTLLKADAPNTSEYEQAVSTYHEMIAQDQILQGDGQWDELRKIVGGGALVSIQSCSAVAKKLALQLTSRGISAEEFKEGLDYMRQNAVYMAVLAGPDIASGITDMQGFESGDQSDAAFLGTLSKKIGELRAFLTACTPHGDVHLGALIFEQGVESALTTKETFDYDERWIERMLMNVIERNGAYKRLSKAIVFLKAMLMSLEFEQAYQICSISEDALTFGYNTTGNSQFLAKLKDEKSIASVLEQELGL